MNNILQRSRKIETLILNKLRPECDNCFGFCCVALYFSKTEGFPHDKKAGEPCMNLQSDFRCKVHKELKEKGFKGCLAYDCFGAGQKVAQDTFNGLPWRHSEQSGELMFQVYIIMKQLHEMLWYLKEAVTLQITASIHPLLIEIIEETIDFTNYKPDELLELDLETHRKKVKALLQKTSELVEAQYDNVGMKSNKIQRNIDYMGKDLRNYNLKGTSLKGSLLIASDLREVDLSGANLIGADLRDADIRGANLSKSIFLTQAQINSAKGDVHTKLPTFIIHPKHW